MTDDPGIDRLRVRPYALTGGRVRSSTELALETIVVLTDRGSAARDRMVTQLAPIADLAESPISIVEISARLSMPLGVARVLVGDMVTEGFLNTHRGVSTGTDQSVRPDQRLLERVLHGLQAI